MDDDNYIQNKWSPTRKLLYLQSTFQSEAQIQQQEFDNVFPQFWMQFGLIINGSEPWDRKHKTPPF